MVTTSVARSSSDDDALCTSGSVDDEGYGDYQFKRMPFELQGVPATAKLPFGCWVSGRALCLSMTTYGVLSLHRGYERVSGKV